jgi:hypothetical protein
MFADLDAALAAKLHAPDAAGAAVQIAEQVTDGSFVGFDYIPIGLLVDFAPNGVADRSWLVRLLHHERPAIAMAACAPLLATYALDELVGTVVGRARIASEAFTELALARVEVVLRAGTVTADELAACVRFILAAAPPDTLEGPRARVFVEAVGKFGNSVGLPFIVKLLEREEVVCKAALTALMRLQLPLPDLVAAIPPDRVESALELAPAVALATRELGAAFLVELFSTWPHARSSARIACLEALERIGSATDAPFVAGRLDTSVAAEQSAAIDALAVIGTTAELARLYPLASGFFRKGELKTHAQSAIDAIVARCGSDGLGDLAVVDDDHVRGALALASDSPDEAGIKPGADP